MTPEIPNVINKTEKNWSILYFLMLRASLGQNGFKEILIKLNFMNFQFLMNATLYKTLLSYRHYIGLLKPHN